MVFHQQLYCLLHYYLAETTHTRRFLKVEALEAVPITVFHDTPILLQCSLPPIPPDSVVLNTIRSPTCASYIR
jgi:hypothetical protein